MGSHQSTPKSKYSSYDSAERNEKTGEVHTKDDVLNNNYKRKDNYAKDEGFPKVTKHIGTRKDIKHGAQKGQNKDEADGGNPREDRRHKSTEQPKHGKANNSAPGTPIDMSRSGMHSPPSKNRTHSQPPSKGRMRSPSPKSRIRSPTYDESRPGRLSRESRESRMSKDGQQHSLLLRDGGPHYCITYCSDNEVSVHRDKTEVVLETVGMLPGAAIVKGAQGTLISPLKMDVMCETESRLHFKIFDPNNERYEVRYEDMREGFPEFVKKAHHTLYSIEYRETPFGIRVARKSTGHVIFDSCLGSKLHFEDEKIQMSTAVHSQYLYGLGEHQKRFLIDTQSQSHNFVFWARDQPPKKHHNLYGCHPFFMALEEDGNAYGVFLLNSCAMEVEIKPSEPPTLTYTVNGGILDFYIFTGPSPIEVIQQYQEVIGRPHLPPYWALGFHLCRWGYESVAELNRTIESNKRTSICYESQWTDIDMMKHRQSWTYHDTELTSTVHNLHGNGQRYVNIVNPGVPLNNSSLAYNEGVRDGIFIKNFTGNRPLVGKVWPGDVVYPDFSHPDIYNYWFKIAQSLYKDIPFDGLWLDMNEPASFVAGCVEDCSLTTSHPKDKPAFVPKHLAGGNLFDQTICTSARQHQGFHYELHNLYGHMEMMVSDRVCRALRGKRTLIISRSTFPGSGHYGGHWTGDNSSTFSDLAASIPAVLDFNLFGIPLVGADIGGFFNSCSDELMIRWMQLGSFYPFMRNHNSHPTDTGGSEPQDPASYCKETQDILADIVSVRYSLLPYLYTLLFDNHTKGPPVVRPLFMLYPKDKRTYSIDEQFMWGSSLLISPCLKEGQTTVNAYFPYDVWYDFFTGCRLTRVGTDIQLPTPLHTTNMHVRGGSILVTQTPARNTSYSRQNPFGLLAALDSNHVARGKLYWDNGDELDPVETNQYNLIKFSVVESRLTTTIEVLGYKQCTMKLRLVQLFGIFVQPEKVYVNGQPTSFSFTEDQRVLQMDKLDVSLMEPLTITW